MKLNLTNGTFAYEIRYTGDATYKSATLITGNLTVYKDNSAIFWVSTNTTTFLKNTPFKGTLTNRNSKALTGVTVTVNIKQGNTTVSTFSGVTDNNGDFVIYHPNDGCIYDNNHSYSLNYVVADNGKCGSRTTTTNNVVFKR